MSWWVILVILIVVGVVVSLLLPNERERAISNLSPQNAKWYRHDEDKESRVLPKEATNRDLAYISELYARFGDKKFGYAHVKGKRLRRDVMLAFDVRSGPLDDKMVLGSRLPELGLLHSERPGVYCLTDDGVKLAKKIVA